MKRLFQMMAVLVLIGGSLQAQYLNGNLQSSHIIKNQRSDLIITKIRILPSQVSGSYHLRRVIVEVTIKNIGKAVATSSRGIQTMLANPQIHTMSIKRLAAGESKKLTFKTYVSRSTQYLYLQSSVDYKNAVRESNEKNNYKKMRIKLPPYSGKFGRIG